MYDGCKKEQAVQGRWYSPGILGIFAAEMSGNFWSVGGNVLGLAMFVKILQHPTRFQHNWQCNAELLAIQHIFPARSQGSKSQPRFLREWCGQSYAKCWDDDTEPSSALLHFFRFQMRCSVLNWGNWLVSKIEAEFCTFWLPVEFTGDIRVNIRVQTRIKSMIYMWPLRRLRD